MDRIPFTIHLWLKHNTVLYFQISLLQMYQYVQYCPQPIQLMNIVRQVTYGDFQPLHTAEHPCHIITLVYLELCAENVN